MMESSSQPPGYRPFPSFDKWKQLEVSLQDVSQSSRRLAEVKKGASSSSFEAALERTKRAAAVDTNAIEGVFQTDRGFTRTVAFQLEAWERQMEEKGKHVRPAFEDALEGFEYVLDAVTGKVPISQRWIRELHAVILRSQKSHEVHTAVGIQSQILHKGEYKTQPNSPTRHDGTIHAYAPVEDTPAEMARFISELTSENFQKADTVIQATYAHYALVCIHPFADGNGRIARTLASTFLYRDPGVPLLIYQDQRGDYIQALEMADDGDPKRLVRFIAERVTDAINLVITDLTRPASVESAADQLAEALRATRILPELQDAALRLQETLYTEIRSLLDEQGKKMDLDLKLLRSLNGSPPATPAGYTALGDKYCLYLFFTSKSPRSIVEILPLVLAARSGAEANSDLVVVTPMDYRFDAFGRELEPVVTESLRSRVRIFAEGVVNLFLAQLTEAFKR
ncbi:Fic family protein [Corynebacterium gallinarum]|uniref:Fic family protein n=1 Tax=Corynebacterium gallinarum TaxID=2762214 RepID=A0A8I0LG74_9CORY|nr:Fic family protein [Corynebacterium gallinarum]MBD8031098.1 Fic family protein [Corynebacterium gallinarum]